MTLVGEARVVACFTEGHGGTMVKRLVAIVVDAVARREL